MKKTILIVAAFLTFGVFTTHSFAQTTPAAPATAAPAGDAIVALTTSDDYVAISLAVRSAGLAETLEAAGPYTIFAPSNDALKKIPSAQLDALLKDPTKLAAVLKGHVVSGKYTKNDLIKGLGASKERKMILKTLAGQDLVLSVLNGKLQLTDAQGNTTLVNHFDLQATNGVIHGVDALLIGK